MQHSLQIFQDEQNHQIRTINIDGAVWFYAQDVCEALEIKNPRDALSRLEEDERRTVGSTDSSVVASRTNPALVSESGLYNVIFQSRKDEAKKFRKWVTSEVLPQLRKVGAYSITGRGVPNFIRRFNDNWDRVDAGYFSVISELVIRLYGRLEHLGYAMPDKGTHGKEIRPDVSVGIRFSKWIKQIHPEHAEKRKKYMHIFPDGSEVEAFQYHRDALTFFIEFVDTIWIPECAETYFADRDPKALPFLPKLLPPPSPEVQKSAIANSKFEQIKNVVANIDDKLK